MSREIVIALIFLTATTVLTAVDVVADMAEGSSLQHIAIEVSVIAFGALGVVLILRQLVATYRHAMQRSEADMVLLKQQADQWQAEAQSLLQGLASQIDRQFSQWLFTPAEKEVALLLIKGLSQKDIAQIRGVQEKTIRLQCTALYKKSGLGGRAELSAFFLEDLLLPQSGL